MDRLGTSPCYAHDLTANININFTHYIMIIFISQRVVTLGEQDSIQGVNKLYKGYSNAVIVIYQSHV